MLYLNFVTTPAIAEGLQSIQAAQDDLDPFAQFPYEFSGELRRAVLAQSVHYSTRLEGNTLTLDQVQAVLGGQQVQAPPDHVREVENYRDAMAFVQSMTIGRDPPITDETIRTIHFLVTKNLSESYAPGRYRTEQNFVVDQTRNMRVFFPPPPEEVPTLMAEYVAWLNSRQEYPAPIRAALAHLNLVAIHPFLDGNGRTARVLESLVMYAGGFKAEELVSLEAHYGQDNQAYYRVLRESLGPHYSPPQDVTILGRLPRSRSRHPVAGSRQATERLATGTFQPCQWPANLRPHLLPSCRGMEGVPFRQANEPGLQKWVQAVSPRGSSRLQHSHSEWPPPAGRRRSQHCIRPLRQTPAAILGSHIRLEVDHPSLAPAIPTRYSRSRLQLEEAG